MSAPRIGEYLEATAHRREEILRDQKFPAEYKQVLYEPAKKAIRTALLEGGDAVTRLDELAVAIETAPRETSYRANANRLSAQAVKRFARVYPVLALAAVAVDYPGTSTFTVRIEDVVISASPLVLLKRVARDGSEQTGALLVVFGKANRLGDRSGKAIAHLLRHALTQAGLAGVNANLCIVVDLGSLKIFRAPSGGQRVSAEVAAACREIVGRWPSLQHRRAA